MKEIQKELQLIKELLIKDSISSKEILTVEELADYLSLSKSCIYKLKSLGEIPCYCPGGKKKYFKKSEIEEWIFKSRVESLDQLASETDSYLSRDNQPHSYD